MTKQLNAFALSTAHRSNHAALIFTVYDKFESVISKRIIVPKDPDKIDFLCDLFASNTENIDDSVDILDLFFKSV
jgi:hypothetical protein